MQEGTSLVWRNAFYLDSLNSNDLPRHLISMEEIHISMREIQISMQEIRNVRLATLLPRVATCWELKIEIMHSPGTTLFHEPDHNIVHHSKMLHEKFDQPQI